MSWSKKYSHMKPYKRVRCINASGCKWLKYKVYGVIAENDTVYRIQFDGKGSKQYSKDWFTEDLHQTPPPPRPKIKKEIDNFDTSTLYNVDAIGIDDLI